MTDENKTYRSESLIRGLAVLCSFGPQRQKLRVSEIAALTGISRAAVRRFLLTLQDLGYVASDGDRYFLRPRVLNLGHAYLASANVAGLIQPLLVDLADRTSEACTFGVLDDCEVLVVARASKRVLDLSVSPGARLPIVSTALGQVLLGSMPEETIASICETLKLDPTPGSVFGAKLESARRNGYACIQGDLSPGLMAVAIPVHDGHGEVVAAVNVTTYETSRDHFIARVLPLLEETGSQLEAAIRSSPLWDRSNLFGFE